jgi:hypothetical protein
MTRILKLMSALSLAFAVAACSGEDTKTKPAAPAAKPAPAPAAAPAPAPSPPADPTASWKETRAQGFVVRGPNAPHTQDQSIPTLAGTVPATLYTDFVSPGASGALQVMVTEIPADITRKLDPKAMMSGMLDGAANAVPGGKVVDNKKITVGTTEGTEVILTGHHPQVGGFKARMRFFLVQNRIYQVQAIYAASDAAFGTTADQFVDSFAFGG